MERKLIITRWKEQVLTSLLENGEIVEFHCSPNETKEQAVLGNIYVGKVKNIVPNIGAAFVEVAKGVECYYALDENETPIFTQKIGKKPLCIGDELLVQVSKEAVKTKVPTVSGKLSFTGKYAVLTTGDTRIGISSKLPKESREHFQKLAASYQSDAYGFIIRTNAKDVAEEVLKAELEQLIQEYEELVKIAGTRVCYSCLKKAPKQYLSELKNIYQDGLKEIVIEDPILYEETIAYLKMYQPEDLGKVHHYEDTLLPLDKLHNIERKLEDALKERVWLKSGAYLVIQPTEALTVIDVNTGKCISKKRDERTYLKINIEAAKEVAKQIRLRNLSGIILVDFINLSGKELMAELVDVFQKELRKDPISTTLVDITKLQFVEVTRKKVRKPLKEAIR